MSKKVIKQILFCLFIIIILVVAWYIVRKYDVEGEKNLPYSITKILMVSSVNGDIVNDPENIWNINVSQINDMYMYIDKTEDTEQTIKEIKFENFVINNAPQKGNIKVLRPTGELDNLYTSSTQDYLNSNVVYTGATIDDMKALEISNIGGIIGLRFSNDSLGSYISQENEEITYDGKLLSKMGITLDEIKFNISFDIIITTSNDINYKGTITLDMPVGNILEEGTANTEITDFSNVIFKRI